MTTQDTPTFRSGEEARPRVIMGIDSQEWTLRSLESVIAPRGFAFVRAYTARQALDALPQVRPDAVIVASRLPDMAIGDVLRRLASADESSEPIPVTVLLSGSELRGEQVAMLEAGAWSLASLPMDPDLLVAQLASFVRARRRSQAMRSESLVDPVTGLYALGGLHRRSRELAAEAYRENRPLACAIISLDDDTADSSSDAVSAQARACADLLKQVVRQSDVLARLGPREFAIVASGAQDAAFDALIGRVKAALKAMPLPPEGRLAPRVGRASVAAYREAFIPVTDLLERALDTLRLGGPDRN